MVETVFKTELSVGEHLAIRKNRIAADKGIKNPKRMTLVSGIHGDELEGQYICYEVARRIKEQPDCFKGIMDIFPALNPLGIDMAHRSIPVINMDMNRMFPGDAGGNMTDKICAAIIDDIIGSDVCFDIHASDIFVKEIPQVRLSKDFADKLLPIAKLTNVDVIWMNATATVHEATLAHSLNLMGVPTMVIELGQGHSINVEYGNQVVDGIFNVMSKMGMWTGEVKDTHIPAVSGDGEVEFIRSETNGLFISETQHNHYIRAGELIGKIVDPYSGDTIRDVIAAKGGLLFTLRNYPVVYEGDLIARILTVQ